MPQFSDRTWRKIIAFYLGLVFGFLAAAAYAAPERSPSCPYDSWAQEVSTLKAAGWDWQKMEAKELHALTNAYRHETGENIVADNLYLEKHKGKDVTDFEFVFTDSADCITFRLAGHE